MTQSQAEHRKNVWRAARDYQMLITLVSLSPKQMSVGDSAGLLVYADERHLYCDGRTEPVELCTEIKSRRLVVFLPVVEERAIA